MENGNKIISGKEDFLIFMTSLIKRLKENPDEWENKSLQSYLEAMADWIDDMDGYYRNTNQPLPQNINWKFLADALDAASMYE